jgi:hypothetical protein
MRLPWDRWHPELRILIADDSQRPYARRVVERCGYARRARVWELPFDSGLSAGRNWLIRRVETPWLLMCDDDFAFHAYTGLDKAHRTAEEHGLAHVIGPPGKTMTHLVGWPERNYWTIARVEVSGGL